MVLTNRTLILAGLLVLLAAISLWSPNVDSNFWRIPAAVLILAVVAEGLIWRRVKLDIQRKLPSVAYLGQPFLATLQLQSAERYPLSLEGVEDYPDRLDAPVEPFSTEVPAFGQVDIDIELTPEALGIREWHILRIRARGCLGLAWWRRKLNLPASLSVVPDYLHAEEHRAGTDRQGRYARPAYGVGTEVLGFRDYHPGDPLRIIDWKATARRAEPTVRVYANDEHVELMLVIDAGRTSGIQSASLTRLGHYANVAARLAQKALYHGDHVGLVVFADTPFMEVPSLRGKSGLVRIRNVLGELSTQARESNPLTAALKVRQLARQRSLVVLFTELDEGEGSEQLRKATSLLAPKHQPVVATLLDEEILNLRWSSSRRWQQPYEMLAALEQTKGIYRTAMHLRRSGAKVVLARPAELDNAVIRSYDLLRANRRV